VKKLLIRLTLAVLIIVLFTPAAFSELLVYEPFDYPVGDLKDNSGAFGLVWGWGEWWLANEKIGPPACTVEEDSLIHPDYPTMEVIGNHATVINGGDGEGLGRPFADDGESYWLGFLYQYVPGGEWGGFEIFTFNDPNAQAAYVDLWGGYPGLTTAFTDGEAQRADVDDPQAVLWVVIKAETSGSPDTTEMIYMWIDPSADLEPDTAAADVGVEYNIADGALQELIHLMGFGQPIAYRVDEIKIGTDFFDISHAPPCEMARYPEPVNNEVDVDSNTTILSWQPPSCLDPESVIYDVYLSTVPGDDPNFTNYLVSEDQAETSYDVSDDVTFSTTYYWRVDVQPNPGDPNVYEGDVWTFTTASRAPIFKVHPEDVTVAAGGEASFTVAALNYPTYQWYYSETPDGAGGPITGATSATYTKYNVQEADEGYYYCVAVNDDGEVASLSARLLTERLMAHWMFEGNLEDQVDPANDGTSIMPVSYTAGVDDGQAVVIEPNEFVMITNQIGRLKSITVSAWINQATLEGDQEILTATEGSEDGFVHLAGNEGIFTGEVVDSAILSAGELAFGQWNHCVMIYDAVLERMRLYFNGELATSGAINASIAPLLPPLSIGAKNLTEGGYLDGSIDDVRIYNYPLSSLEIAKLYNGLSGDTACVYDPPEYEFTFDLNGDCVVDILDIEILAMNWANCNIVPDCQFSLPQ